MTALVSTRGSVKIKTAVWDLNYWILLEKVPRIKKLPHQPPVKLILVPYMIESAVF
jgi:hypothetical protein